MKKTVPQQRLTDRVIEITERFNATPKQLFRAWTNEKEFAAWFGPVGFESVFCKLDVRVGGSWRAGISDKDGDQYFMEGKYLEVVEGERLVFTFNDGSKNQKADEETIVTVTFSKSGNQTIMKFNQSVFKTVHLRDNHYRGWASGFICLRNHLEQLS